MKYLIFSPFQAIESHTYPEAMFSDCLRKGGHKITYLGCDKFFENFCIAQASYGLSEKSSLLERQRVCKICNQTRRNSEKKMRQFFLLINDFYDERFDDDIENIVQSVRPESIKEIYFHEIPVGRIAAYEFLIHYKVADITKIPSDLLEYYKIALRNSLKTLVAIEKIFSLHTFDRVLLYNSAYSVNNTVREVTHKKGIPLAFMHASFNLKHGADSMYLSWKKTAEYDRDAIQFFEKNYPDLNLDYSKYRISLGHIETQLQANSVFTYSSKRTYNSKKITDLFRIGGQYKKIVLLSMSSFDEAYANDFSIMNDTYLGKAVGLFANQVEWLQEVILFFQNKKDIKLIIRVHPREFPNKREQVSSPRVEKYKEIFKVLPENISVDYPEFKNSIYDLFEIIDLHLTSQTTTGCESAILGIRGIASIYGIGNYPMRVINPVPKNKEAYFSEIDNLLLQDKLHSIEIARKAFDWYLFLHTKPLIFFNTNNYWKNARSGRFGAKIMRKLRVLLGSTRFSLSKYLSTIEINELEKKIFLSFMEGEEEILNYRYKMESKNIAQEEKFKEYIRDLFSTYYRVPLSKYSRFICENKDKLNDLSDGYCEVSISEKYSEVFIESRNAGGRLCVPEKSKIAKTMVEYLSA